jgi:hypothetical protein
MREKLKIILELHLTQCAHLFSIKFLLRGYMHSEINFFFLKDFIFDLENLILDLNFDAFIEELVQYLRSQIF